MKKNKVIGLSLYAILALQVGVFAQSNENKNTSNLGDVEVIASDEDKESYTVKSMGTSTKLALSIRDTPQSVSVITTQKLEDMGISSYDIMLNNVTGISLNRADERLKASARGFVIDYYKIDGMPTYTNLNSRDIDLSIYDRVEIVRGANGLTTGSGNPGLSINLVRKRAHSKEVEGSFTVDAGSWNAYSLNADIGSGLNEDGTVRGRIVLKHEDADSYMDGYSRENNLLYGVVDADINDTTYLSTGISYQNSEKNGIRWGGLPAFYTDGTRTNFDRSLIVSEDWTYYDTETKSFFTNFKQDFSNNISLNADYSYNEITQKNALLYFGGTLNKDGSGLSVLDYESTKNIKEHNLDVNINVPFEIGELSQEIIIGSTYNLAKESYYGRYPDGVTSVANLYNYKILLNQNTASLYTVEPEEVEQKALYLAGKFQVTNNLNVIAGTRLSTYEYSSIDSTKDTRKFSAEFTPYLGLVYDLDKAHSLYTSYTSIFKPQSYIDANDDYLDPIEGKSYEVGLKGEYFENTLNASVSLFRTEQDNVGEKVDGLMIGGTQIYKAVEGVTSKGLEIDISGQVTDNFSVDFGIANFEAKDKDGKKYNSNASRTTANIFAKYKLQNFTIGGGVNYKSKYYAETNNGTISEKSFYIVNLMGSYEITKNIKAQINIQNLLDKKYYEGIGSNSMTYGAPVNYTASLKYSF